MIDNVGRNVRVLHGWPDQERLERAGMLFTFLIIQVMSALGLCRTCGTVYSQDSYLREAY